MTAPAAISSDTLNLLVYSAVIIMWVALIIGLKDSFMRNDRLKELQAENKELRKRLRDEADRITKHYELLLKDAAIKNALMTALYDAWNSGKLKECYSGGGEVRILADGTLICSKAKLEESYTIEGKKEGEGQSIYGMAFLKDEGEVEEE